MGQELNQFFHFVHVKIKYLDCRHYFVIFIADTCRFIHRKKNPGAPKLICLASEIFRYRGRLFTRKSQC